MKEVLKKDKEYLDWLLEIKSKIRSVQVKAAMTVNSALIEFYWELGKMIVVKQSEIKWGEKLIDQVASDLKIEFPDLKGLSSTNLKYCKRFYLFYNLSIGQQLVDQLQNRQVLQLPWGHNILIFTKSTNIKEALFYIRESIKNNWSRDVLGLQIKSKLYDRQGKAISNFQNTLPVSMSDLAEQTLKDPYIFDFMTFTKPVKEKDIEKQLVTHITNFLLELGKGFAFVGQQYHIEIADNDYYIDLLFYHIRLKCYVVIELKNTKFIPEYTGKLNFYLSAVDSLLKQEDEKPTIGLLLCRDKNDVEAEFSLRRINSPIGICEFQLTEMLPEELKSSLPTIEEIENELKNYKP